MQYVKHFLRIFYTRGKSLKKKLENASNASQRQNASQNDLQTLPK